MLWELSISSAFYRWEKHIHHSIHFSEHILCARHWPRSPGYSDEQTNSPHPSQSIHLSWTEREQEEERNICIDKQEKYQIMATTSRRTKNKRKGQVYTDSNFILFGCNMWHMGSSFPTRYWNCAPCVEIMSLNYGPQRKSPREQFWVSCREGSGLALFKIRLE